MPSLGASRRLLSQRPLPRLRSRRGSVEAAGVVVGALAIVLGSAALGLVVNHLSPRGIPVFGPGDTLALPLPPGVGAMGVAQAHAAWQEGEAAFVDARPAADYQAGHVPGALNLPPSEFEVRYPDIADRLEAAGTVVVYCEGMECADSLVVAERLREVYPGRVFVVEAGWPAWVAAGHPVATGAEP